MTPRQIHALEFISKGFEREMRICFKEFYKGSETSQRIDEANRAIAQAWHDYRTARAAASAKAPRRALQRVGINDLEVKPHQRAPLDLGKGKA